MWAGTSPTDQGEPFMRPLLAAVSMCLASAAFAGGVIVIDDNNRNQVLRCDGQDLIVNGNSSNLTMSGECPTVTVNGNRNTVAVESVGKLRVLGNDNQVSWGKGTKDKKP